MFISICKINIKCRVFDMCVIYMVENVYLIYFCSEVCKEKIDIYVFIFGVIINIF